MSIPFNGTNVVGNRRFLIRLMTLRSNSVSWWIDYSPVIYPGGNILSPENQFVIQSTGFNASLGVRKVLVLIVMKKDDNKGVRIETELWF